MSHARRLYHLCLDLVEILVEPLRVDESLEQFTLAVPEAQTTTVDSVQGWSNRPPAILRCPGCAGRLYQRDPIDDLDCADCWRSFRGDSFGDHELVALFCPRCRTPMEHGIRHPQMFDVPEFATCPSCQYHWDLDHWF